MGESISLKFSLLKVIYRKQVKIFIRSLLLIKLSNGVSVLDERYGKNIKPASSNRGNGFLFQGNGMVSFWIN